MANIFVVGENLHIKCTTQGYYSATMFSLYKDNGLSPIILKAPSGRDYTVTFHILNITSQHQGNYTCTYDVEISGKTYTSAKSDRLEVIMKGKGRSGNGSSGLDAR
eukprot:g12100.t1